MSSPANQSLVNLLLESGVPSTEEAAQLAVNLNGGSWVSQVLDSGKVDEQRFLGAIGNFFRVPVTSVDAKAIDRVGQIVQGRLADRPVVVVSAMAKVTDSLLAMGKAAEAKQNFEKIVGGYANTHQAKRAELFLEFIRKRYGDAPKDTPAHG